MNQEHLDDEALSAAIDGEAEAAALDHVATCPACRSRLEALRAVASAVSTPPVPLPAADVDRAIAAALDTALAPAAPSGGRRGLAPVVALFQRRPAMAALAAAAVVVLAAGITGAVRWGGSSSHPSASVSLARPGAKPFQSTGAPVSGAGSSGAATLAGPDLGAQSDPAVVAGLVRARIGTLAAAPGARLSGPQPGGAAAAPQAPAVPPSELACASEAAQAVGVPATSPLRLVAGLLWRGQPAVVFVFDRPGTAGGLAGVIIHQPDCATLVALPL
jgi:hypothetical protein